MARSIERRLEALEARIGGGDERTRVFNDFLRDLSDEELCWLLEPGDQAQSLVPCPHVEMLECACSSDGRVQRGFEAHPGLREEYLRRRQTLLREKGVQMQ